MTTEGARDYGHPLDGGLSSRLGLWRNAGLGEIVVVVVVVGAHRTQINAPGLSGTG